MSAPVTIIIPAYRCADTIGAAIASALEQTLACNVIVVDDASGDGTVATARAAEDGSGRLTVLEQTVNQGPSAARNRAINAAGTDWIALLDADDRMAPDRIETLLERAIARDWDMIADDIIRVSDWHDIAGGHRHWRDEDFGEIEMQLGEFARQNVYTHCGHGRELGYMKPLMRRAALGEHGLVYNEAMRLGEDFDLYARAMAQGVRFGMVDPAGYFAFDTPGSLSKSHRGEDLRQVWLASRALLKQNELSVEARAGLKEHAMLSHKKWAWVRLIEAVRARNLGEAAASFIAPPAVIGELATRLGEHFSPSRQ